MTFWTLLFWYLVIGSLVCAWTWREGGIDYIVDEIGRKRPVPDEVLRVLVVAVVVAVWPTLVWCCLFGKTEDGEDGEP